MGTYNIPRNLRGETRILIIFSVKSLITTGIGLAIGAIFFFIFSLVKIKIAGIIIMAVCALLGYAVGAMKIPTLAGIPFTKKIGGESLDEIIKRYAKFKMNKKIYTYTKEEE